MRAFSHASLSAQSASIPRHLRFRHRERRNSASFREIQVLFFAREFSTAPVTHDGPSPVPYPPHGWNVSRVADPSSSGARNFGPGIARRRFPSYPEFPVGEGPCRTAHAECFHQLLTSARSQTRALLPPRTPHQSGPTAPSTYSPPTAHGSRLPSPRASHLPHPTSHIPHVPLTPPLSARSLAPRSPCTPPH